jgi:hypothetical protein
MLGEKTLKNYTYASSSAYLKIRADLRLTIAKIELFLKDLSL